jgi:putative solute:sodium symporter small subunit
LCAAASPLLRRAALLGGDKPVYTRRRSAVRAAWAASAEAPARGDADRRADHERGTPDPSQSVTEEEASTMQLTEKHLEYWNKNLRVTAILLLIWFVVTYVIGFFARELSFNFFGWPFAFYMGAQGALIIYVILIWYYARYMNNLDRVYDVHEGEDE